MQEIVPSLLSADFSKLEAEIRSAESAGATRLHLDVMDGHFVPNLTFGPIIIKAIRKLTQLHLETHLMIEHAEKYLDHFIDAGSDTVLVHVESSDNVVRDLAHIRNRGKKAGLVINPPTDFSALEPYFDYLDHLLVMTVNPGFGGQTMITEALQKVVKAQFYQQERNFLTQIDGGVNFDTVRIAAKSGVNLLVAGSAFFSNNNHEKAFRELTGQLNNQQL
ncbi:MAG: ribulose-phosphate 3-epimerase [Candidatus Marinimicrobia bacterium]|nr:ribulose-phosphate 3-epimerase [Candidatus Neomarinimicrobiota bacterium]